MTSLTPKQLETAPLVGARFSPDRMYRYALWRTWNAEFGYVMFIGLNPSTADERIDDPTIRRCTNFARSWGYGGIYMLNLFAFRATDPKIMKAADDPVGPDNDVYLAAYAADARLVVAAWGVHGRYLYRDGWAVNNIPNLHHLGLTKDSHPRHPLYLRGDTQPRPWRNIRSRQ